MLLDNLLNLPDDKKILILGLGKENLQFLDWLFNVVNFSKKQVIVADKRQVKLNYELDPENLVFGENYLSVLKQDDVEYVFKAPGIWSLLPEIQEFREKKGKTKVNSSLVFFFERFREQIIAVTGTKGKSTTSSLINHLLNNLDNLISSEYCGNTTGISPYNFWTSLEQAVEKDKFFVVETSSFQLEDLGFAEISPKYAVITNYYVDHLDQHLDAPEYWHSKNNIFLYQHAQDLVVSTDQVLEFSSDLNKQEPKIVVTADIVEKVNTLIEHNLIGQHNKINLTEAVVLTESVRRGEICLNSDQLIKSIGDQKALYSKAMTSFNPLGHRLELVRREKVSANGNNLTISFYDDGFATEPDAVIAAINSLTEKSNQYLWLQVSGVDKGGDLGNLAKKIVEKREQVYKINYCGAVGLNLQKKINNLLVNIDQSEYKLLNFKDTVKNEFSIINKSIREFLASDLSKTQDLELNIVLSPCGSSFDEFENYIERSNWWVSEVQKASIEHVK